MYAILNASVILERNETCLTGNKTREDNLPLRVLYPSTNPTEEGLTLLSRRNMLLSLWYSDSTLNASFFFNF